MNSKKIRKKVLVLALSSMFVLTSTGGVDTIVGTDSSNYRAYAEEKKEEKKIVIPDFENKNTVSDASVDSGSSVGFYFKNGEAKVELSKYKTNSKKNGYLLVDIKKDYVKGYSDKYFSDKDDVDDAMRIHTNFNSGIKDTVVEDDFCSYEAKDSDYIRFYVPYKNATSKMTVTFTIPGSVQKKIDEEVKKAKKEFSEYTGSDKEDAMRDMIKENEMRAVFFSEEIDVDDTIPVQTGDLVYNVNKPVSGFVNIDTYTNHEEEKVYQGFVFDGEKENRILRIKPKTTANRIRLYLGAGDNGDGFSFDSDHGEFDIKYYSSGDIYRKVNDGKVHDDDDFKDNEYKRESMSLSSGFNSVDLPWETNDGIIEIRLNKSNNFLLNLKVEAEPDINVNPSTKPNTGTTVKPDTDTSKPDEKLDAKSYRLSGSNRYDTAIELSKKAFSKSETAIVASGQNFADALAGGSLAAAKEAPLLLVDNSTSTIDAVNKELRRLGVEKVFVLGGKNAISVSTEMKITNDDKNKDKRREVERLSGKDRYETSYEIFKEVTKSEGTQESPILVNGKNFADALSAGALSANLKRGIVLTDGHNVNSKINKKSSDNIVIGGYASMDSSFGGKRISGANRYETSVNVAKYFHNPKNVMLASGEKYPDGLASISLYKKYEGPLLLTPTNTLPKETKKYIKNNDIEDVYIIGGTNSVSSKIENMFK